MQKVGEVGMKEYIVQAFAQETIDSFDAHNAPELVRCKDCEHSKSYSNGEMFGCEFGNGLHEPDWFCADGKRR